MLVGINLLREGLDLPEVSLVAILDADKEGFLRSGTSLIQTIGRAARNVSGEVHMYADKVTDSMRNAIDETERRPREADRVQHRARHRPAAAAEEDRRHHRGSQPRSDGHQEAARPKRQGGQGKSPTPSLRRTGIAAEGADQLESTIADLTQQMLAAAAELKFELAGRLRDEVQDMKKELRAMERAGHA